MPASPTPVGLVLVPHRAPGERSASQTMARTLEVVGTAAAGGFAACYFPEHHLRDDDYVTSPLTLAAHVTGRWPGLKVGTGVALPALHNPLTFAEQLATLDVASGGALHVVGVGLGDIPAEFAALGIPHAEMVGRFVGAVDALRRLWRGETVDADLGSLHLDGARLSPRSPYHDELPLAIGAMSDRGVRRAARLGLPWLTDPMQAPERLQRWADLYWGEAGPAGRVILMRQAWPAPSREEAIRQWWPHARDQIFSFSIGHNRLPGEAGLQGVQRPEDLDFEQFGSRYLLGPPAEIVGELEEMAASVGADEVVVRVGFGSGPAHAAVVDAVGQLGRAFLGR